MNNLLKRSRAICCLALLWLAAFPAAGAPPQAASRKAPTLRSKIDRIIRASEARRGHWGIELARLSDGKILYAHDADRLFVPASNMKLYTTAAGIEKLGPGFRFRTTVEVDTRPDAAGRVGDIYLVGRGDPFLGYRMLPGEPRPELTEPPNAFFQRLADEVASRGVREVTGNVIADDTYFVSEPISRGWEDDDLIYGYAAPVSALSFNDNALLVRYSPGNAVGDLAVIESFPFADYFSITNQLITGESRSRTFIKIDRRPGTRELRVWGDIAVDTSSREDGIAVNDPPQWVAELFYRALVARGIRVSGSAQVLRLPPSEAFSRETIEPPPFRIVLVEQFSQPLAEDIKIINKFSHNLHAEMLFRTIAHETTGEGSQRAGIRAMEDFVLAAGIEDSEAVFSDGSGLSRHSIVAPHATVKLLSHMAKSPHFELFLESLPIAGEDGTLEDRYLSSSARSHVRAKTGTLEHVNTLSGYMDLPSGERLVFSIMGNEHPMRASQGKRVVDRIVETIYEHFGG